MTEESHHDSSSFRVRGKIFATVPDDTHLRMMVDEMEIRAAVAENPDAFQEFYWGKRLACVVVDLERAKLALVKDLLTETWNRKAPATLVKQFADR